MATSSPEIKSISWGEIQVAGLPQLGDVKLWPGGGRAWDWRETDTHHVPGIQPADIQELLDNGCEVLILSRGMQLQLATAPETIEYLEQQKIEYHVLETSQAVALYNKLAAAGIRVGGLFHSTC